MPVPERIRGAYIEYLDSMADAAKSRRPVDGLLGFSWSESDRIQERFANELRSAVEDFAAGRFGLDGGGRLCFREAGAWQPCRTVEYDGRRRRILL